MLNKDGRVVEPETEAITSLPTSEINDWANYSDDEVMQQQSEEAGKIPFVGDKVLTEQYAAIRRTRADGNCFFRSFMFAYLEHILESQDRAEVDRITVNVEQCRKTLLSLGYAEFTFEDFFRCSSSNLKVFFQGKKVP